MTDIGVKGDRDGIILTVGPHGDFDEITSAIVAHLDRGGSFFKGAHITLDVGARLLTPDQLQVVRDVLGEYEVTLQALRASEEETRNAARDLAIELPFKPETERSHAEAAMTEVPEGSQPALIVHRTLRSGQVVRHPDSIVLVGDVNPGAEVVSGGDVIVLGALRGVVHAGASGNEQSIVCALDLAPTQLRIGGQIARPPEEKRPKGWLRLGRPRRQPEQARIRDGAITVEPWLRPEHPR